MTREQLAAILWNYAKWKGYDVSAGEDADITDSPDFADTSEWARPMLQWAFGEGVLEKNANKNTRSTETATRAEIAKAILVFLEKTAK